MSVNERGPRELARALQEKKLYWGAARYYTRAVQEGQIGVSRDLAECLWQAGFPYQAWRVCQEQPSLRSQAQDYADRIRERLAMQLSFDPVTYGEAIAREGEHWGNFADGPAGSIPFGADWRRATPITHRPPRSFVENLAAERVLRDGDRLQLIRSAAKGGGRALDLGCGAGWLSLELARNGLHVVGVEVSEGQLGLARQYLQANPFQETMGSVAYVRGDLNRFRLAPNAFDVVVAWDALHHIPNLYDTLGWVSQSLKPSGRVVVFDHIGAEKRNYDFARQVGRNAGEILRALRAGEGSSLHNQLMVKLREYILTGFSGDGRLLDMPTDESPFEDAGRDHVTAAMDLRFDLTEIGTRLAFAHHFHDLISLDELELLKKLDDALCAEGLLRGEYVLLAGHYRAVPIEDELG